MAQQKRKTREPFGIADIGATKLACFISERNAENQITLLGQSVHAADGIKNGDISDLEKFRTALGRTIELAEQDAGVEIKIIDIVTSFGDPQFSHHHQAIELGDGAISRKDIKRLMMRQKLEDSTPNRVSVQTVNHDFVIDDSITVENPLGMHGHNLAIKYGQLSLQRTSWLNLLSSAHVNHLDIGDIHHTASMAALACLSEDERQTGALIIDFGGSSTSLAVYDKGYLQFASSVKMGGNHITRDIAKILSLSTADAERVKALDGSALPSLRQIPLTPASSFPERGDNFAHAQLLAPQPAPLRSHISPEQHQLLPGIIIARLEEILELIDARLAQSGLGSPRQYHIAVTGGGSQLTGLTDFLSEYYEKPVMLSAPSGASGLDGQITGGSFAAAMGMAAFIATDQNRTLPEYNITTDSPRGLARLGRFGRWLDAHL